MSWTEIKWLEPFLPNFLKPLNDPKIDSEHTEEFVALASEFLSDLAALSELPRMNKTFKRNIKGYLFKVKIKPRKIHLELKDTKKSSANYKKHIYITLNRKPIHDRNSLGKVVNSTIHYIVAEKTYVRNISHHPSFQDIFTQLHALDKSLTSPANKNELIEKKTKDPEIKEENKETAPPTAKSMLEHVTLKDKLQQVVDQYRSLDIIIDSRLAELQAILNETLDDFDLLDVEEKHHLKRLITNDLPNLLMTYESLTREQKVSTTGQIITSIHSMKKYVEMIKKQVDMTRMNRMNQLLQLNQLRYKKPSLIKNQEEDI